MVSVIPGHERKRANPDSRNGDCACIWIPGSALRATRNDDGKGIAMYENLLANVPTDLWIGGKWRKASDGGRFDVVDPATEKTIASVASATVDDAIAAVDAAQGARPTS
jgi:hypothetical protein